MLSAPVRRIEQTDTGVGRDVRRRPGPGGPGRRRGAAVAHRGDRLGAGAARQACAARSADAAGVAGQGRGDLRPAVLAGREALRQGVADRGFARSTFDNSPPMSRTAGPAVLFGFVGGTGGAGRGATWPRTSGATPSSPSSPPTSVRRPRSRGTSSRRTGRTRSGPAAARSPSCRPGVLLEYGTALREPVGRVHWAGTETSTYWFGYMDGAVRSGERVADEVVRAG